MPIPLQTPITVPQKTADSVWITNLNIVAPAANRPVMANVTVAPFNSTTGDIFRDKAKTIPIADVQAAAQQTPQIAAALQAIYVAVNQLITDLRITF
jgi:hypothetical protein